MEKEIYLTEDEKRLIFRLLTDYSSKLNDIKDEHNLDYRFEGGSGLHKLITRINDLAYKHFNV
jgi:hypothetical protein|tara:strand:+ start:1532 stop:1720 length:189 start_codon:yes stop_codon:yes gene_type:complete